MAYQPSYGNPAQMYQSGEVFSAKPQRDMVQSAKDLVYQYNLNPKKYTDKEAEKIAYIAAQLDLPFKAESKALQKFFFDTVDNLAFGILPESMRPVSRGETVFGETQGEKIAGVASLLGYLGPGAVGAKLGTMGLKGLTSAARGGKFGKAGEKISSAMDKANVIPRVDSRARMDMGLGQSGIAPYTSISPVANMGAAAVRGAASGSGALALTDILEDPLGAPSRALTGAVIGGGIGGAAASLPRVAGALGASPGITRGAGKVAERLAPRSNVTYVYPDGKTSKFFRQNSGQTPFEIRKVVEDTTGTTVYLDWTKAKTVMPIPGGGFGGFSSGNINLLSMMNNPINRGAPGLGLMPSSTRALGMGEVERVTGRGLQGNLFLP